MRVPFLGDFRIFFSRKKIRLDAQIFHEMSEPANFCFRNYSSNRIRVKIIEDLQKVAWRFIQRKDTKTP